MNEINYEVKKINLYEQVADTLEKAIVHSDDTFKKLPSEQELSGRFGVSRTVIREALKVLKERGLLRHVTVRGPIFQNLIRILFPTL